MIHVESKVTIFETDGKETVIGDRPTLTVNSHHNCEKKVVLRLGDQNITVFARDLIAAINNATNSVRF